MAEELIIVREINAPKALVFDAFTQAEHLKQWWGPAGFQLEVLHLDVQVGGKFHYGMKSAEGHEMFGVFNYKEISAPDKIVFTSGFADKEGNLIRAPFSQDFPIEVLNIWSFEEKNGKTTLTLKGNPFNATENELNFFTNMHAGMNEGFNKTFDQLDAYFAAKFQLRKENKTARVPRTCTYLNFPGNTEEAFNFYKSVFKTEFVGKGIQRFGNIPAEAGHPPVSDEIKNMILHIELPIVGGHILMATDAPESMGFILTKGNNMNISVEPESREETKRLFDALAEGGEITMPLEDMFFGSYFGSVTDKYNINWMFNYQN